MRGPSVGAGPAARPGVAGVAGPGRAGAGPRRDRAQDVRAPARGRRRPPVPAGPLPLFPAPSRTGRAA